MPPAPERPAILAYLYYDSQNTYDFPVKLSHCASHKLDRAGLLTGRQHSAVPAHNFGSSVPFLMMRADD